MLYSPKYAYFLQIVILPNTIYKYFLAFGMSLLLIDETEYGFICYFMQKHFFSFLTHLFAPIVSSAAGILHLRKTIKIIWIYQVDLSFTFARERDPEVV